MEMMHAWWALMCIIMRVWGTPLEFIHSFSLESCLFYSKFPYQLQLIHHCLKLTYIVSCPCWAVVQIFFNISLDYIEHWRQNPDSATLYPHGSVYHDQEIVLSLDGLSDLDINFTIPFMGRRYNDAAVRKYIDMFR